MDTPPHSNNAETIFEAALDLPVEEREAFLVNAGGGDADLIAEVRALLAAHEAMPTGFLASPVSGDVPAEHFDATIDARDSARTSGKPKGPGAGGESRPKPIAAAERSGDRIGPYKLLQEIGEGGFGTVWMAEQDKPVRRRVALKIIKLGMDTKEVVARFEQERQALAMMDHPNIARVFDAGATEQGRPFFVMELVRGMKITDYCDEKGLSTVERVELFILVCQAVQHAHQKGIIHRDLKPSNILVTVNDGRAVPKVIDFGVAKATQGKLADGTLFTQFEQMIGTPLYMSPEQAEMTSVDVDTRSDIYSLGVLLYELLTGRTPIDTATFAKAGIGEIRRIIREVDPVRPSARLKTLDGNTLSTTAKRRHTDPAKLPGALRGDIDWIVMKCLEKDRARRYDTANGLALDLQRHLANEVITARPPTAGYLLGKLIRRNKLAFAAGTAIAASLVIGIAASVWQAVRATRAEKAAIAGEQRATAAFDELRATAPAFAEQARGLAAKEQYADAIAKLDYAIKLRPDAAEFLVAKGDLLQCQLQLAPAAAIYREALRVQPGHARAGASAKLCEELLAAPPAADGKLSRESLAKLHVAMQQQQRSAAELLPVARLLGEEKRLLLDYWLARLKDLPVSAENPLAKRLTLREDGRLALDLNGTKVTDLSPLAGAPLAVLHLNGSTELTDLSPLAGLALIELYLGSTLVTDLTPLREMHSLETLAVYWTQVADLTPLSALRLKRIYLNDSPVTDLTALQKMPLEELHLRQTRVTDLSPLSGMPIKILDLGQTPVRDFSPLARMPLEKCYLAYSQITDLTVLRGRPLKELSLSGCEKARKYSVLAEIPTLESLLLPDTFRTLPDEDLAAIGALRTHPKLRQIQADFEGALYYTAIQSKDLFWQDWDRLQSFLPALHKSGLKFTLTKLTDGTYELTIGSQPLSDLSFLKGAPISRLWLFSCRVSDLTPLRSMPLRFLHLFNNPITDFSPLRGMQLEELVLGGGKAPAITDLSPLAGMPLKKLVLAPSAAGSKAADLAPLLDVPTLEDLRIPTGALNVELLRKMPNLKLLAFFNSSADKTESRLGFTTEDFWKKWDALGWLRALNDTGVLYYASEIMEKTLEGDRATGVWSVRIASKDFRDCSIFNGAANIRELNLAGSAVTDLAPLADCKGLQSLILPPDVKDIEFLRASTRLQRISHREDPKTKKPAQTAAEFWKEYDTQGWLKALRATGVAIKSAKQLEDGTWDLDLTGEAISDLEMLGGAPISILKAGNTAITDLAPLRGMALKELRCFNTKITDLSPLQGMPLEHLHVSGTPVTDLTPLRGMGLITIKLHGCTQLTDLTPLAEAKTLTSLTLPPDPKDIEFLRTFPRLERLGTQDAKTGGGLPGQPVAEFWKEWDAGK